MTNKNILISGVVVVLLVVIGFVVFGGPTAPQQSPNGVAQTPVAENQAALSSPSSTPVAVVITFTDAGYSPKTLTIKKGTTVTFKNESAKETWPASSMHPSHAGYDGTTLREHCANQTSDVFDACGGIKPGESWVFTFNKVGDWKYHDHLAASFWGEVVVTE